MLHFKKYFYCWKGILWLFGLKQFFPPFLHWILMICYLTYALATYSLVAEKYEIIVIEMDLTLVFWQIWILNLHFILREDVFSTNMGCWGQYWLEVLKAEMSVFRKKASLYCLANTISLHFYRWPGYIHLACYYLHQITFSPLFVCRFVNRISQKVLDLDPKVVFLLFLHHWEMVPKTMYSTVYHYISKSCG